MTPIRFSREASRDLLEISAYSFANFGYDVASAYMRTLNEALERLRNFPELGRVVREVVPHPRCLPCNSHRIFYRIEEDGIMVLRILHHRMDAVQWLN